MLFQSIKRKKNNWICVVPALTSYCSALKNLRLTEEHVAKVVKDRIFSAAFHPSVSSLLVAAGDKWGKVGLWNLVSFILLTV